ncbi:hypothetical protein F4780DRAFT_796389 [Xylariomycetidae sp. FL0641]|nr:hypothetical protein F4780DRAFT_796389 [Xylariomycetidae sp. FL0641]
MSSSIPFAAGATTPDLTHAPGAFPEDSENPTPVFEEPHNKLHKKEDPRGFSAAEQQRYIQEKRGHQPTDSGVGGMDPEREREIQHKKSEPAAPLKALSGDDNEEADGMKHSGSTGEGGQRDVIPDRSNNAALNNNAAYEQQRAEPLSNVAEHEKEKENYPSRSEPTLAANTPHHEPMSSPGASSSIYSNEAAREEQTDLSRIGEGNDDDLDDNAAANTAANTAAASEGRNAVRNGVTKKAGKTDVNHQDPYWGDVPYGTGVYNSVSGHGSAEDQRRASSASSRPRTQDSDKQQQQHQAPPPAPIPVTGGVSEGTAPGQGVYNTVSGRGSNRDPALEGQRRFPLSSSGGGDETTGKPEHDRHSHFSEALPAAREVVARDEVEKHRHEEEHAHRREPEPKKEGFISSLFHRGSSSSGGSGSGSGEDDGKDEKEGSGGGGGFLSGILSRGSQSKDAERERKDVAKAPEAEKRPEAAAGGDDASAHHHGRDAALLGAGAGTAAAAALAGAHRESQEAGEAERKPRASDDSYDQHRAAAEAARLQEREKQAQKDAEDAAKRREKEDAAAAKKKKKAEEEEEHKRRHKAAEQQQRKEAEEKQRRERHAEAEREQEEEAANARKAEEEEEVRSRSGAGSGAGAGGAALAGAGAAYAAATAQERATASEEAQPPQQRQPSREYAEAMRQQQSEQWRRSAGSGSGSTPSPSEQPPQPKKESKLAHLFHRHHDKKDEVQQQPSKATHYAPPPAADRDSAGSGEPRKSRSLEATGTTAKLAGTAGAGAVGVSGRLHHHHHEQQPQHMTQPGLGPKAVSPRRREPQQQQGGGGGGAVGGQYHVLASGTPSGINVQGRNV